MCRKVINTLNNKQMKKKQIFVTSASTLTCWAESFVSEEVFERIKNNPKKIKSFEKDMDITITTARDADGDCMLSVSRHLPSATSKDFESLEEVLNRLIATVEGWEANEETSQGKRQRCVELCKAILCDWDNTPRTCGAVIVAEIDSKGPVVPVGLITENLLKKLLQCYVEHNS